MVELGVNIDHVATIREALGDGWLELGWAEIAFRRQRYDEIPQMLASMPATTTSWSAWPTWGWVGCMPTDMEFHKITRKQLSGGNLPQNREMVTHNTPWDICMPREKESQKIMF